MIRFLLSAGFFYVPGSGDAGKGINWQAYSKPLNIWTWLAFFAFSVAFAIIFAVSNNLTSPTATSMSQSVMDMVRPMVCQSCPQEPDKLPGRALFFPACLFGFIIWHAYSGKLTSLLAAEKETLPFTSLEEMLYKTSHTLVVPGGTYYPNLLKVCFSLNHDPSN